MKASIHVLDTHTANRIAAGEVVDRPASVVKELVENAIDAGATQITVEAEGGGIGRICVRDNGSGIAEADVPLAFARHATSKIRTAEDLEAVETMGFRGEALASIAAVAQVELRSKTKDAASGNLLRIAGGAITENMPVGCPDGTRIEVANLFYNTPARLKFLKSPRTEAAAISDFISRAMLAYPEVAFRLLQNGRTVYQSAGDGDLRGVLAEIYGADCLDHLREIQFDDGYTALSGFAGTEQIAKNNRLAQSLFVNRRYVKSQKLSFAVQRVYDTRLMSGKFPLFALHMRIASREIDVNVHPNKMELRFRDEERVLRAAHTAFKRALGLGEVPSILQRDFPLPAKSVWGGVPPQAPTREEAKLEAAQEALADSFGEQSGKSRTLLREALAAIPQTEDGGLPHVRLLPREETEPPAIQEPPATQPAPAVRAQAESPGMYGGGQIRFSQLPYRIVGQIFACYIVVEQGEDLFFIDQHAAHERRLYEKLRQKELRAHAQMLLSPRIIKLSAQAFDTLMENMAFFAECGFEMEEFGPLTVSVRAVPYVLGEPQTEAYLHEVLQLLQRQGRASAAEAKRDLIIMQACKRAVKAGQSLDTAEIEALLADYREEGVPLTCPHGRPVMARIGKKEMEKLFKRLV